MTSGDLGRIELASFHGLDGVCHCNRLGQGHPTSLEYLLATPAIAGRFADLRTLIRVAAQRAVRGVDRSQTGACLDRARPVTVSACDAGSGPWAVRRSIVTRVSHGRLR